MAHSKKHPAVIVIACAIGLMPSSSLAQVLVGQTRTAEFDMLYGFDVSTNTMDTLAYFLADQDPACLDTYHGSVPVQVPGGAIYGVSPRGGKFNRGSIHLVDTISHRRITLHDFPDTLLGK